jgi:hypothetical protein
MNIKEVSRSAITDTKPYDWHKAAWNIYAIVLAYERNNYPNAPRLLEHRIWLRQN